jgi:histone-lysine N-methyltransferase SETMAR
MQKSRVKTMLIALFCAKGIIRHEFVLEKQTANSKFYKEVIKKLTTLVYRIRPEVQESGSWYLLHDSALAHYFGVLSEFLAKQGIPLLSHPPYSPDLAMTDFCFIS